MVSIRHAGSPKPAGVPSPRGQTRCAMAVDAPFEDAQRSFVGQLMAIAGVDAAQRIRPALDKLLAEVASAAAAQASAEATEVRERNRMLEQHRRRVDARRDQLLRAPAALKPSLQRSQFVHARGEETMQFSTDYSASAAAGMARRRACA